MVSGGRSGRWDAVGSQVGMQGFRNQDGSVRLLMRFDQRHKKTGQGGAASVQNVRQAIFAGVALETQVHAPRLKVLTVGAARYFEVGPLPWRPDLDVVGHG